MKKSEDRNHEETASGRKLAEWISLIASGLVIVAISTALIYKGLQENGPIVQLNATPLLNEVQETSGRFVLPVRVKNHGGTTVHDLKVELSYQPEDDAPQTTDSLIDYLGEHSEHILYFYFERDPRELAVEVRPASYRLE